MREQFQKWGIVCAALAAFCAFTLFMYVKDDLLVRSSWCHDDDISCLRDWISALGGWAALAIGAPTVFLLARQIKGAESFNKAAIKLQATPVLADANHLRAIAVTLKSMIPRNIEIAAKLDYSDTERSRERLIIIAEHFIAFLGRLELRDVNSRYMVLVSSDEAVKSISNILDLLQDEDEIDPAALQIIAQRILPDSLFMAQNFADELSQAADRRYKSTLDIMRFQ